MWIFAIHNLRGELIGVGARSHLLQRIHGHAEEHKGAEKSCYPKDCAGRWHDASLCTIGHASVDDKSHSRAIPYDRPKWEGRLKACPLCYSVQHAHHRRSFLCVAGREKKRAMNVGCKSGESR
jgi:hypothetical protein